jgi:RNA polymerase sigma-70 factor (ECF subfamily)
MKAFAELYHEHLPAVFRFAMSVSGRREAAEDLAAEAFLALYRNLEAIDESRLPGWLLTVVRNRARDAWRRQATEQRYVEEMMRAPPVAAPSLEKWILESPELKAVHRTCVMLRYVYGLSRAEIAIETGLTETQVKGHLQYALTLLRKAYNRGPVRT